MVSHLVKWMNRKPKLKGSFNIQYLFYFFRRRVNIEGWVFQAAFKWLFRILSQWNVSKHRFHTLQWVFHRRLSDSRTLVIVKVALTAILNFPSLSLHMLWEKLLEENLLAWHLVSGEGLLPKAPSDRCFLQKSPCSLAKLKQGSSITGDTASSEHRDIHYQLLI